MSRIGKTPVTMNPGVSLEINGSHVMAKGPKGNLSMTLPTGVSITIDGQVATVSVAGETHAHQAMHGLVRAELENMVKGVSVGWNKYLTLSGVGYRAAVQGTDLVLNVGFSHPVTIKPPTGIAFAMKESKIEISGIDKQLVGQVASDIRKVKPPEPYKGKGIMYEGEHIRKKAGKSAKGVGGAPGAK